MAVDMFRLLANRALKVPHPSISPSGRAVYKIALSLGELYAIANDLRAGKCTPKLTIPHYSKTTVQITENRRHEVFVMKFYAANENQAESVLDEINAIVYPFNSYQGELDL